MKNLSQTQSFFYDQVRLKFKRVMDRDLPNSELESWELDMRIQIRQFARSIRRRTSQVRWDQRRLERNTAPAMAIARRGSRL